MDANLVANLHDQQMIRDLLSLYCELLDEYRLDELLQLFSVDCVTDYGPGRGGPGVGQDLLRKMIETSMREFIYTHHQLGQVRISLDGERATSVAYVTADHKLRGGQRETIRMQYKDRLSKLHGQWRITYRETRATIVDGAARVERVMLQRRSAVKHESE